jgi:hypothetical protein
MFRLGEDDRVPGAVVVGNSAGRLIVLGAAACKQSGNDREGGETGCRTGQRHGKLLFKTVLHCVLVCHDPPYL